MGAWMWAHPVCATVLLTPVVVTGCLLFLGVCGFGVSHTGSSTPDEGDDAEPEETP